MAHCRFLYKIDFRQYGDREKFEHQLKRNCGDGTDGQIQDLQEQLLKELVMVGNVQKIKAFCHFPCLGI